MHLRFNHRTSPLPNFAMISSDSASFSNRRSHIRLEVVSEPSFGLIVLEVFATMALV